VNKGEVWDVTGLSECVIVSPDSMNDQLDTIIVVPLTTKLKDWPTRVQTEIDGIVGQAICEQIRTVSKQRLKKKKAKLKLSEIVQIRLVLRQMLFD
jgi:mRNA interferase MazF